MKSKEKIYLYIVIILVFVNILLIAQRKIDRQNSADNGIRVKNEGTIAFGAYDGDMKIETGSLITNREINHNIEIEHNLLGESKYLFIVLVDYEQRSFQSDNEELLFKKITIGANESKRLNVKLKISNDAIDLCYLIIKEPDYFLEDDDLERSHILQQVISMQYKLSATPKDIVITPLLNCSYDQPIPAMFLSETPEDLKVTYFLPEKSDITLTIGNKFNEKRRFGVIKLLNWEQLDFEESKVKFFELEPGQKGIYNDILPNVDNKSNIQYISFPYAMEVDIENYVRKQAEGTFRLKIIPE